MTTLVIPFRALDAKRRLGPNREKLAGAMLEDVADACRLVAPTIVADAPGGQGAAVAAVLRRVEGPVGVVNADLPCITADDVAALLDAAPALVPALDGTTNALALTDATAFRPLYGPGSAERFASLGLRVLELPNLVDDVDTLADLERVAARVGRATRAVLEAQRDVA
jgi:2-phospho-L-lactate guanylyltransferase (CobY/MobA/RfbA family)